MFGLPIGMLVNGNSFKPQPVESDRVYQQMLEYEQRLRVMRGTTAKRQSPAMARAQLRRTKKSAGNILTVWLVVIALFVISTFVILPMLPG